MAKNDNNNPTYEMNRPKLQTQHVPNQSISSNTDRSNSPMLISPTSPPLVEITSEQMKDLNHHNQNKNKNLNQNQDQLNKGGSKSNPSKHKKTPSTNNQGSRFPSYTTSGERQCTNCSEIDTPQWRGTLCNACALWKRSRGTDRPLPLLFPVKRRSPTPEEEEDGEGKDEEEIRQIIHTDRNIHSGSNLIRRNDYRELSPIRDDMNNNARRKFWVDRSSRANSEIPNSYQVIGPGQPGVHRQNNSNANRDPNAAIRPRLGMGMVRGAVRGGHGHGHGHGRAMSYQHSTHHRGSSLSQPFPNLSITPPKPHNQLPSDPHNNPPQTGRIQGIHSTPVSPTHHIEHHHIKGELPHPRDYPNSHNRAHQHAHTNQPGLDTDIDNNVNLQNRIAPIMSQAHLSDQGHRKRRNPSPIPIIPPITRSYSSPTPNNHQTQDHTKDRTSEEVRSPYLPYSLDKKGKSKLGSLIFTLHNNNNSREFSPTLSEIESLNSNYNDYDKYGESRKSNENPTVTQSDKLTELDESDIDDLDIGLNKEEFLQGAEWFFDILQSTSRLLRRSGSGEANVSGNTSTNGNYDDMCERVEPNQNEDENHDQDQGGLNILGKVAEEEYNKVKFKLSQSPV